MGAACGGNHNAQDLAARHQVVAQHQVVAAGGPDSLQLLDGAIDGRVRSDQDQLVGRLQLLGPESLGDIGKFAVRISSLRCQFRIQSVSLK